MDKKELRKAFLKNRSSLSKSDIEEKSLIITKKVLELSLYKNADWVFCYINMGSEVITRNIIKTAWEQNKKVAVPIAKNNRFMYFVEINSFDNMSRSKLGVEEPDIPPEKQVFPDDNAIMIVPGSAFDTQKNRFGYGGGYYDTYTEKYNVKNTVGICFDIQLTDKLPVESFDRALRAVVTEKRVIL